MALQTFGVNQTVMQSYEPQIKVGSDGPITVARLTILIESSAGKINGMMTAAGLEPATLAADSSAVVYINARRLIAERTRIDMQAAAYGSVSVAAELGTYDERARAEIREWVELPASLGEDVPDNVSPGVRTSTQSLGLNTADTYRRRRRRYDRARDRTTNPDDTHRW